MGMLNTEYLTDLASIKIEISDFCVPESSDCCDDAGGQLL